MSRRDPRPPDARQPAQPAVPDVSALPDGPPPGADLTATGAEVTAAGVEVTAAGPELARAVLDAARAKRAARPAQSTKATGRRLRGYSGAGPDPRDPQPFGEVLTRLLKVRGWQKPAAEARLFGMWADVVGPELAAHSRPVRLVDGELTVEADSTAWATQIRLLAGKLVRRIAGEVGAGVVTRLSVHGPVTPSWSKGPKRVRGRGPRDTYG